MKERILFLFCTLLLVACGGGGDDGGGGTPSGGSEYLNVSNVDIPGGNTTATLIINASQNCDWIITWSESWIRSINPTKGRGSQNVTITVSLNPSSTAARTAVVRVSNTSGSIVRDVTVTQSPNTESLELSMSTMNFTSAAGSQDVTITSNTHWTISGSASWMSLNKTEGDDNGSVRVTVEANTSKSEREVVLTFRGSGGLSQQLTVKQEGDTSTEKPTVAGLNVRYDDKTSAVVSFSYSSSVPVTEYGVCYNTTGQPTINDTHLSETGSATQGSASFTLTNLAYSTTYYVCAYVVSAAGIQYSDPISFTTVNDWPGGDDNVTPGI